MRIDIGGVKLYVDIDGRALVPDGPHMLERPTVRLLHGGPGMITRTSSTALAGELDPVCPIEMSDEIVAALVHADVIYERIPQASHDDVGRRSVEIIRSFISANA